eukprot:FR735010.1.p1 GENE.FR735010.1~~FR735010.1.p1  ORF type:complete len:159 (+),score=17.09 FR735010.1:186-662(+)
MSTQNTRFIKDVDSLLRPETVESLFLCWRVTRDKKYQDWGWAIFEAIERTARVESGGFAGLRDIRNPEGGQRDVMESFFMAETLKYLFLLFGDPDHEMLPLDEWVFNTEAHPLRVQPTRALGGLSILRRFKRNAAKRCDLKPCIAFLNIDQKIKIKKK